MTNPNDNNGNAGGDQPYEPNPYDATQLGQPQYGQTPQYGQAPQYGETPQFGQPDYGQQPQYGAQFAQPQYGQAQYGQPSQFGGAPGMPPDDNLVWAILSTVLCCLPLGVVSIIKSTSVSKLWAMGDHAGAQQAAEDAKKFAIWSAVAAVASWVIFGLIYVVIIVAAVNNA
ncbi:CD225/dispanin family protein [Gordonia alkaliphila]|uniref:CD225/dispanin family protein n=1 Tax=Gordonia alkaliphila TaxID=1053547 RepID=UPI003558FAE1